MKPTQGTFCLHPAVPPIPDHNLISDLLGLPPEKVAETLSDYDLRALGVMTEHDLREAGLTPTKAKRLHRAFELARRYASSRRRIQGEPFSSPRVIFEHFSPVLRKEKREVFLVVLLDVRHRVIGEEVVSVGSLTSSIVHPREVFLPAVRASAGAVVLVHNHPSGDPRPSDDDVAVTRRLLHAAELLGIRVLDHVVVGDGECASFREQGLL